MPREGVILLEDRGINFVDRVPYLMPVRSDVVAGHAEQGQCWDAAPQRICHFGVPSGDTHRVAVQFRLRSVGFFCQLDQLLGRLEWDYDPFLHQPGPEQIGTTVRATLTMPLS